MKSRIKLENDWHGYSKAEKVILAVVLALVVLVVISWAADGFAFNETRSTGSNLSQIFGAFMATNVNHSEYEHNT
jgi:glycerol uptake facilitator-like aquaporin